MQLIAEAASLVDGRLRELAAKVETRLVYPLNVRGRPIAGLHQKRVGEIFGAFERQPAFRQKSMPDHGEARQQDADEQRSRVTGFPGSRFVHFAHALAILPSEGHQYRDRYRQLRTGIDPTLAGLVASVTGCTQFKPRRAWYPAVTG